MEAKITGKRTKLEQTQKGGGKHGGDFDRDCCGGEVEFVEFVNFGGGEG